MESYLKINSVHSRKCIWECRLLNGGHFVWPQCLNNKSHLLATWQADWHHTHNTNNINTSRPRQNGRYFADNTFKSIFLNENVLIQIEISLKFVPKGPFNNISALVQIMAWCQWVHICVTRPQWVNTLRPRQNFCHFADIFKHIFFNENMFIFIEILLRFVPEVSIDNKLVQIMAWHQTGDKLLFESTISIEMDYTPRPKKIAKIMQRVFSNGFSWKFSLKFCSSGSNWQWVRIGLGNVLVPSHYLNQWLPSLLTNICISRLQCFNTTSPEHVFFLTVESISADYSPREPHALAWGPSSSHTKIFRVERMRLKTGEKITDSL